MVHHILLKLDTFRTDITSLKDTNLDLLGKYEKVQTENSNLKMKLTHTESMNLELKKLIDTMTFESSNPSQSPQILTSHLARPANESVTITASSGDLGHDLRASGTGDIAQDSSEGVHVNVTTENRFSALAELSDERADTPASDAVPHQQPPAGDSTPRSRQSNNTRPRVDVDLISDSMGRGVAELVDSGSETENTDSRNKISFNGFGYIYPGRTAREINKRIRNIDPATVTVISVGVNNVEKQSYEECTKELHQVFDNLSKKRRNHSVIISNLPHRFDKPNLNGKIDHINSFIQDEVRKYKGWRLLRHNLERDDYTQHGLHFNDRGKLKFANEIRRIVRSIPSKFLKPVTSE